MKRTIYKYLFRLIMMMDDMQVDVKVYLDIMMIKRAPIDYLHLLSLCLVDQLHNMSCVIKPISCVIKVFLFKTVIT